MTLAELLVTLREDILHDTSDRVSGDSDQLWTDSKLVSYISLAQRRFARRSLCIRDGSSAVTKFTTVAFQQDYVLDKSILNVFSARNMGNGAWVNGVYTSTVPGVQPIYPDEVDMRRTGHNAQRNYPDPVGRDFWETPRVGPGSYASKPLVYETDETMGEVGGSAGVVTMRVRPVPNADFAGCLIQLRVARLPLVDLTLQNMEAVPEVPEDYHVDMLDYAAYLALRIVDHEAGDTGRAQEFQASFDKHVEEARTEIQRKTFVPMTWGFGGSGYTYTPN